MSRALMAAAVVAFGLLLPSVAWACPTCFAGTENRETYFLTFVLLTTVPLVALGGTVWWFARRARAVEARNRIAREGDLPSGS